MKVECLLGSYEELLIGPRVVPSGVDSERGGGGTSPTVCFPTPVEAKESAARRTGWEDATQDWTGQQQSIAVSLPDPACKIVHVMLRTVPGVWVTTWQIHSQKICGNKIPRKEELPLTKTL